ncbi:Gmad2 immunoglobulin-like domain-containing protein [Candidatus Uhrbacteria bacterium]|nr:Gmad2 immunoglobulin-like domain-containing protein [Candidatus Uhrbacteria bacterium]
MTRHHPAVTTIIVLLLILVGGLLGWGWLRPTHAPRPNGTAKDLAKETQGKQVSYKDLLRLEEPLPQSVVGSPLTVSGSARGTWYFEASFPIDLVDEEGVIIAKGVAQAQGDWMTPGFVPFTVILPFAKPLVGETGTLILHKENPSGDPLRDDAFELPIRFAP